MSHGTQYDGPSCEPIRIWGTRRLLVLRGSCRWSSGSTSTSGHGLSQLLGRADGRNAAHARPVRLDDQRLDPRFGAGSAGPARQSIARTDGRTWPAALHASRAASLDQIQARVAAEPAACAAALNHLAHTGQVIYDLTAGLYRWRQVMPMVVGDAEIGPENAELAASRQIVVPRARVTSSRGKRRLAAGKSIPARPRASRSSCSSTPTA